MDRPRQAMVSGWALAALFAICAVSIFIDAQPFELELGAASLAVLSPIAAMALAVRSGPPRHVAALLCLALTFSLSLGPLEIGFGLSTGLALLVVLIWGPAREASAAIGALLLFLSGASTGFMLEFAFSDSFGLFGALPLALAVAGALCFSVSARTAALTVLLGWLTAVAIAAPAAGMAAGMDVLGGGAMEIRLTTAPPVEALALVLTVIGSVAVRRAALSGDAPGFSFAAAGLALVLLYLFALELHRLITPAWSVMLAVWSGLFDAYATPGQPLDQIVVTGTQRFAPSLATAQFSLGAAVIGLALGYRGLILIAAASLAALAQMILLEGELFDWASLTLGGAIAVVAAASWVRHAPITITAPAFIRKTAHAASDRASTMDLDAPVRNWRTFNALRRRLNRDPDAVRAFAASENTSTLQLKLKEVFYAGLPALALATLYTVGIIGLSVFNAFRFDQLDRLPAYLTYEAATSALSYTLSAYVVPLTFLVLAASAAWTLAVGRAANRAARRLYLSFDAVHGLWPQAIASIGLTLLTIGIDLTNTAEAFYDVGAAIAIAGNVLLLLMLPWLFWLAVIKIPVLTGRTYGARGLGLFGRVVAHYGVTAVTAAAISAAFIGADIGIAYGVNAAVRLAFGL